MVKKIFLILGIIFLLLVISGAVFLATFDADRYRPMVIERLEDLLGQPVTIEHIQLKWRGGIAAGAHKIALYSSKNAQEPAVSVEDVDVLIRFFPLLKKQIQIASILVEKPSLHVVGEPRGMLRVDGVKWVSAAPARAGSAQPPTPSQVSSPPAPSISIDFIEIKNGVIRVTQQGMNPPLDVRLQFSFRGTFSGWSAQEICRTLHGQGHIRVPDGLVLHVNVLREVFSQFSIIPGLVETLQARLPESYQEKMRAEETVLKPMDLNFTIQNGSILFQNLQIDSDTFILTGSGQVRLDGNLNIQAQLRLDSQLSASFIGAVKELDFLTDEKKRIQFPVTVQGQVPRVTILPDIGYLTNHVVSNKAEELIGTLLQRVLQKKGT